MLLDETKFPGIKTVKLELHRSNSTWKVNNTTWDDIVKSNYQTVVANPQPDEVQIWEITNKSGGWFHPTHIHLVDFKILSRNGKAPFNYELGPKDVAYVGENETVRLITKFAHQTGRYMIHCHNLPHEDHDMMTQFRVGADTADNDPMTSDPARRSWRRPGTGHRTRSRGSTASGRLSASGRAPVRSAPTPAATTNPIPATAAAPGTWCSTTRPDDQRDRGLEAHQRPERRGGEPAQRQQLEAERDDGQQHREPESDQHQLRE